METLYEEVDLAVHLLAEGRDVEALEVAAFLPANIAFAGNYNLWCPVGNAIAMAAFLCRKAGDEAAARSHIERLVEHPTHANREPKFYEDMVTQQIPKELEEASADSSTKWARHRFARVIQRAVFWRETNVPGFHHFQLYDNDLVEKWRDAEHDGLRRRMLSTERPGPKPH
jgi:hypothetical protein